MLMDAYGEHAHRGTQYNEWFNKYESGDFDLGNWERRRPPKTFKDDEMRALLDENDGQTQGNLKENLDVEQVIIARGLKAIENTLKIGKRVSHELPDSEM